MTNAGISGTGTPVGRPAMKTKTNSTNTAEQDVLLEMRNRFDHVCNVDSENRDSYVKNTRISSTSNQWDDEVKKRRGINRPALTFNILNPIVKNIIGDYRQNKLAIKILPAGGTATEEIADILAGLIRNIETDSHADQAYTNALECAARGNRGYYRILPEYEADDVFNQKLVIKPIHNPLTVYCDPAAKMITREDAEYYLITEMMPKAEFRRLYPKAEENGWDLVDIDDDDSDDWSDDNQIRICEYFTKERVTARLAAFNNGAVVQIDNDDEIRALEQIGWNVTKEREASRINIKWRKCTGNNVLETKTYKTKYIPIIPVIGEEINIEGKTHLRSAVYYSIDAQHSYNYERSTAIERNALSAKAPWLVTPKQIEMFLEQWKNVNATPQPYLVFTPDPSVPGAIPTRIEPPTPAAAEMQNAQAAAQDVQRTSGVFDAQLGEKSNVLSGIGLREQQSQGTTTTFIFPDNLRTAIEYGGRVLIDWIPTVYDTERVIRTINSEDSVEMETVNQQQVNPILGITEVLNDITVGKYDVIVEAGKAFASRRAEAVDGMMKFAQNFPNQAPIIADLMIQNMDVPGGEVMAARLKRALPPQIANDPDSPEGQAAAQQAQQQQAEQQGMQKQLLQAHIQTEQGKQQAEQAKAGASVVKSQAEVVKAKSEVIKAGIEEHNSKLDHAVAILDANREIQPEVGNKPTSAASSAQPTQPQGAQIILAKHPDDIAREQKQSQDTEMLKQGLGMIAQHLALAHNATTEHTNKTHEILGHIVKGNEAIGNHIAHSNAIALAPVEAIRDRAGRMSGSKKVLKHG